MVFLSETRLEWPAPSHAVSAGRVLLSVGGRHCVRVPQIDLNHWASVLNRFDVLLADYAAVHTTGALVRRATDRMLRCTPCIRLATTHTHTPLAAARSTDCDAWCPAGDSTLPPVAPGNVPRQVLVCIRRGVRSRHCVVVLNVRPTTTLCVVRHLARFWSCATLTWFAPC